MSSTKPSSRPRLATVPLPPFGDRDQPPRLPAPLSSLVGREREIAAVVALLNDPTIRLVTLTGPGGVGKTRLALAVAAHAVDRFAAGAAFVDLAPITDPDLVAPTIAAAFGLRHAVDRPATERLAACLRPAHLLLVLDNFERVLPAAPVVTALLAACPNLTVLVTSRERLHLSGEQVVPVDPLPVPAPDAAMTAVATAGAVLLFAERARAVDPAFALDAATAPLVAEICRRLDGLPLAIELAAPRVRHLALPALRDRLERRLPLLTGGARDQPGRLRTMQDAIAWSHDLLPPPEQALLRRLAVFAGGCTLEAAEAVCGTGAEGGGRGAEGNGSPSAFRLPPSALVLDGLAALIDASLLGHELRPDGAARYRMLETIREFAGGQLAASGEEAAVRGRHTAYYLTLAERGEAAFWGTAPGVWRELLEPEVGNFRAALAWALEQGDVETALRLAGALEPLRWLGPYEGEERQWLQRALDSAAASPTVRAKAVAVASLLATEQTEQADAVVALAAEGLTLARRHGDRIGVANATYVLGILAINRGQVDEARAHLEDALARFRALGDRGRTARALCDLAVLGDLGTLETAGDPADLERSEAYCQEALRLFRELGHSLGIARTLHGLAYLADKRRDYPRAVALLRETLALRWELQDRWGIAPNLEDAADIAGRTGDPSVAARLYGAAEALREGIGTPVPPLFRAEYEREVAVTRAALGPEGFAAEWAAGRALPLEQAVAEAMAVAAPTAPSTRGPVAELTRREREILSLLAAGETDPAIAAALYISVRTVENHVAHIFAKLGVRTRMAAASVAVAAGLVAPDSPQGA